MTNSLIDNSNDFYKSCNNNKISGPVAALATCLAFQGVLLPSSLKSNQSIYSNHNFNETSRLISEKNNDGTGTINLYYLFLNCLMNGDSTAKNNFTHPQKYNDFLIENLEELLA
ncbi:MAG: hypothetical protein ACOYK1_05175 [Vampirovibrionia bacterium]|jgi:hypothetical protein